MNGIGHTSRSRTGGHVSAKLAGVLVATSLAIPGAAVAYTVPGDPGAAGGAHAAGSATGLVLHRDGSKAVPFVADTGSLVLHRDASKAVPFVADTGSGATASTGFDWGDALIGAGAAIGVAAAIGALGLTRRRRTTVAAHSVLSGS